MTDTASRARRASTAASRGGRRRGDTPILVRQLRNGIEESVHRGDIVEADVEGRLIRQLGDPDRIVTLRSTVKPFGVVALIEAGGIEAFDLEPPSSRSWRSSHSGEDLHVRTLQGALPPRRGQPGPPRLRQRGHAARRADRGPPRARRREGRARSATCARASTRSRCCSARLNGWDPRRTGSRPSRRRSRIAPSSRGRTARRPDRLRTAIDGCGVQTYAFRLREVAQAFAMLADPAALREDDRASDARAGR